MCKKRETTLVNKYNSIIYRLSQPYFDRELSQFKMGSGQHFFLLKISEKPGISMLELANEGHYDKGATNRAVNKLLDLGYLKMETDSVDKRIRRLFLTEEAYPILDTMYEILESWNIIIQKGLTQEEKLLSEAIAKKMSENAYEFMKEYRKKE